MNIIKSNKVPIIIAFIQWFLTTAFQIDRLFFRYGSETKIYVGIKILYFIFLVIVWCFLFHVRRKIKEQNKIYQRGLYIFSCHLFIVMILLVIIWPGTWSWDDLYTLHAIRNYRSLFPSQHILTGIYQDVLLQILPFPAGIILLQNIIISVCVAFCVVKLEISFKIKRIKYKSVDTIIKIIPFFLFPVLMYQFSGYRIGLYIYLELVMLVMILCAIKDEKEWNPVYLVLYGVLCAVVATWRTESFFYIPFSCVLVFFVSKAVLPNKKKIFCIFVMIIGFIGINTCQNHFLDSNGYKIISLIRPCTELVRVADREEDAELLADIDKAVDLDVIYDNPGINGEGLYWSYNVVRDSYSEEYSTFFKAFIKLSMKYPRTVIEERWKIFIKGSGITGSTSNNVGTNLGGAAAMFDEGVEVRPAEGVINAGGIADVPVFKGLRKSLIYFFGGNKMDGTAVVPFKILVWNVLIPLAILFFAWVRLLVKKKWYLFIVCTAVLIRFPVVVLTQPSTLFMYVLSFYFLGYVYLVYQLLVLFSNRKQIKEKKTDE